MFDSNIFTLKNSFIFTHRKEETPLSFDFHLHDKYEIYFFISGNVNYFVEKNIYELSEGDLIIMNNKEIHKPTFVGSIPYERYVIHFAPSIIYNLNFGSLNLLQCFENRISGENNRIGLTIDKRIELTKLLYKLEEILKKREYGYEALVVCCLVEILVIINSAFLNENQNNKLISLPNKLTPILEYIHSNIDGDLSLENLSSLFYINKYYLCRLFKNFTGSSIHKYVLYKRLSHTKVLLLEGISVTEACMRSGFSDYSNFIRMFKKTTGMTPGQYAKSYKNMR